MWLPTATWTASRLRLPESSESSLVRWAVVWVGCGLGAVTMQHPADMFSPTALIEPADKKHQAVVLPIYGMAVPFHISMVKNLSKSEEQDFVYLRINFNTPGASYGRDQKSLVRCRAVLCPMFTCRRPLLNSLLSLSSFPPPLSPPPPASSPLPTSPLTL